MQVHFIPFAFGFTNLAMLGWLAAAAAPLLIHLWSRHRFREAPWAAMQFLLAAMRKNARRLQLQQWLLLAVRTLIIVLVVLAAAEPYGERLLAGGGSAPTHRVLVIDGSYSMAYRDDGASRFERAKRLAADAVRGSRPADSFTVVLMAAPARTIFGRDVVDHAAVAAEIESLSQSHTKADLAGALALAEEAVSGETNDRKRSERHEVYFFTDLQRSTWRGAGTPDEPANEALQEQLAALARQAPLTVVDVGQPHAANLAVTQLSTADTFVTLDREIPFEATLRQFGEEPRPQCSVELLVDDVPVGAQTVDVSAGGDAAVHFSHRFRSAGSHTITVRTAADRLSVDDARHLVVPVREEVRVLCVAGREGAARYVAQALNPGLGPDSPIQPVIASEADLAELELAQFECIFLCNVAQITPGEAERLRRYAAEGGGLVVFLGDRVVPASYNALAEGAGDTGRAPASPQPADAAGESPRLDPSGPLLPARLVELITQPQFGLDPLEYRHPIVAPFRGRERAGLLTTPVSRYYRLEVPEGRPGVEIAAVMPNGDPFIVTAPLGRGRTALVATAGSLASVGAATGEPWTNWPTWPSFLPIVRELLAFASGGRHGDWLQAVGEPIGGALDEIGGSSVDAPTLQVMRPDGRTDPVAVRSTAKGWEWSYDRTDLSGIYTLRGLPRGEVQPFALNVETAEADLAKADPQYLPSEVIIRDTVDQRTGDVASLQLAQAGWAQSLLWIALALLFVESLLAWKFGRGAV